MLNQSEKGKYYMISPMCGVRVQTAPTVTHWVTSFQSTTGQDDSGPVRLYGAENSPDPVPTATVTAQHHASLPPAGTLPSTSPLRSQRAAHAVTRGTRHSGAKTSDGGAGLCPRCPAGRHLRVSSFSSRRAKPRGVTPAAASWHRFTRLLIAAFSLARDLISCCFGGRRAGGARGLGAMATPRGPAHSGPHSGPQRPALCRCPQGVCTMTSPGGALAEDPRRRVTHGHAESHTILGIWKPPTADLNNSHPKGKTITMWGNVLYVNRTYCGNHSAVSTNTKSLWCVSKTNPMGYVNYINERIYFDS